MYNTKKGACLIIGNGPSLNDIPDAILGNSYPNFGCNFFPMHKPNVWLDNLVMTDKSTMMNKWLWEKIMPTTKVFCFARWVLEVPVPREVIPWANFDEPIKGFTYGDQWGQYFPTSAHAACWVAHWLGYEKFYLVGMDGTSQARELSGVDEFGKSHVPHFYDDNPGKDSKLWDIAWGNMYRFMYKRGKEIVNLSSRTAITQLPRESWREHFKTHHNSRLWTEHIERT
jgi:hypothetical protein